MGELRCIRAIPLTELAERILKDPKSAYSVEDTNPVWNELFREVNNSRYPIPEEHFTLKEKAEFVRHRLNSSITSDGL